MAVVIGVLATCSRWAFRQGSGSNRQKTEISRSTAQAALGEPGSPPKWEILRYRGGRIKRLEVDGRPGFVIEPLGKADEQRRWIWIAPNWLATKRWDTRLQKAIDSREVDHLFYIEGVLAKGFY